MRPLLLLAALLFSPLAGHTQTVLATAGTSHTAAGLGVAHTVGEAVVGTLTGDVALHQGFHQQTTVATAVHEAAPPLLMPPHPNPFTAEVRLTAREALHGVAVFDVHGRSLHHHGPVAGHATIELDLAHLAAGTYVVMARAARTGATHAFRIIKP